MSESLPVVAPELWDSFCSLGRRREYAKGTIVFLEGDPPGDVYGVLSGRVKLVITTRDGREVAVGYKHDGELFGELAAIDGLPRSASAFALDSVELVAVGPAAFMAYVEQTPDARHPVATDDGAPLARRQQPPDQHEDSLGGRAGGRRTG